MLQLVQRVFSKSYLTEQYLSGEAREQFEQKLRSIIRDQKKTWIDEHVSHNEIASLCHAHVGRTVFSNTCTTLMSLSAEGRRKK